MTDNKNNDAQFEQGTLSNEEEVPSFDYASSYSANLPALLYELNISLILTSYQAGQVMLVRSDGLQVDVSFQQYPRPMGLAVDESRIVLGIWSQVLDFRRNDTVISGCDQADKIDACYVPRASHITGMVNIHDIAWGDAGLWIVNSNFSCLATLSSDYSFIPQWKPEFITDLAPEDRCHLNGMAMKEGKPKYVTTFDQSNTPRAWRDQQRLAGTLIDIETNEMLADDLIMPHSPRYYRDKIYFCHSGYGQVCTLDPVTKTRRTIVTLPGFTRGLAFYGPLMVVGTSESRPSERASPLPLNEAVDETLAGIWFIDLEQEEVVGQLIFDGDVSQIYDVAILQNTHFPELLHWDDEKVRDIFTFLPLPADSRAAQQNTEVTHEK
ncbi:TIGR03032 family protein [Motilimonas sp. KMU-193]|uniref:TIGR03032 family protein n=1 Tax=Motilimonas sp. KMU-193 TaxID=3388668 RepID=UPI00396B303C